MTLRSLAVAVILVLFAGCTDEPQPRRVSDDRERAGGVLRVGLALGSTTQHFLDPQKAYIQEDWALFRCCLQRTMLSYSGRPAAHGGSQVRPDLATELPEVSSDRLTWTFHLKPGLHYAPPLDDVEITSADFVRALEREATHPYVKKFGYGAYYDVIKGFSRYSADKADSIAGLETPDAQTLVVHLREPSGDLASLFALHATAPLPPDPDNPDAPYGVAEGHDADFGRYLVSSGPYMVAGDAPYSFEEGFLLLRNPSWDPETDDLRPAYPDRIEVVRTDDDAPIGTLVEEGELDVMLNVDHPSEEVDELAADGESRDRVIDAPSPGVWYVVLNLALPPFDDIHIRKAINHVIDRRALANKVTRAGTDGLPAIPHTHIGMDGLLDNLLLDYRPYGALDGGADLARARAEVAQSRYDSDGDGRCDHPVCRTVAAQVTYPVTPGAALIASDLEQIGITVDLERLPLEDFYERLWPERRLGLAIGNGWSHDIYNASTVFEPLFASHYAGVLHTAMVGATPKQLREWGYGNARVPNVDRRIDLCTDEIGHRQLRCWAELDAYLMEKVVPFVPLFGGRVYRVVSERVAEHSMDESTSYPALDRFVLNERER